MTTKVTLVENVTQESFAKAEDIEMGSWFILDETQEIFIKFNSDVYYNVDENCPQHVFRDSPCTILKEIKILYKK